MAGGAGIEAGWRARRRGRILRAAAGAVAVAALALWRLRARRHGRLADLTHAQLRDIGVSPHAFGGSHREAERDLHRLLRGGR